MNNTELINKFRRKLIEKASTVYPHCEIEMLVDSLFDVIGDTLNKQESVKIKNFGKFSIKNHPKRQFYNLPKRRLDIRDEKRQIIFTPTKRGKIDL